MALVKTSNFLPRVFRTLTNQRFFGATLDHLMSDSTNLPINGYIGRTFAPTYKLGDNYVPESLGLRQNYQLEPSVVVTNKSGEIEFNTGYIDLLRNIQNNGGLVDNQQRLFSSETYNYDGHFDYDKFVNYFNYYWLPNGAASVNVFSNQAPYSANYAVNRNTAVGGYTFTGAGFQPNTQLTLVRGGTYTFQVNQPGSKFWIQRSPGVNGVDANVSTLSTREIYGVTNNGDDVGTVTFHVPLYNAQDFYIKMSTASRVDAAVAFGYTDIQNRLLSDFLTEFPDGLDGINNQLQDKNFVFITNSPDASSWTTPAVASSYTDLDVATIRPGDVIPKATRVSAWKIDLIAIDSDASDYIIQISPQTTVVARQKVFITSGKTYASNEYWLNDNLIYNTVPAITANKDYLYYQDSSNPGFIGEIKLIDNVSTSIDVEADILGKVGYTSPNGVVFTNGLKVQFDSLVTPASYYKFDYSNYTSWVVAINNAGGTITGDSTTASAVKDGQLIGEWDGTTGYRIREWYVEGVGTSIALVPMGQIIVPEDFSQYIETQADYITINRGSQDRNPWSRSNRWFHKDVIVATAAYNNTTEDYGPNLPGRRPIIEFDAGLQLFNFGKQAKNSVDLITFTNTDAFGVTIPDTRIEGQVTAVIDGVTLEPGHRVVFANDYDLNVKNKIWEVTVIENLGGENYINLVSTEDNPVLAGENVLVTEGTSRGNTFRFDGTDWFECQGKTALNQMPLFDLVDKDGYSFSDTTVYPDSTFAGNKIFNYYPGTGTNNDTILGFPLRYQNFNNIGDIVFKNYYDEDTFEYVTNTATNATATVGCGTGYVVHNSGLTTPTYLNAWVKNKEPSTQYQLFTKFFDGRVIDIDGTNYAFVQIDVLPESTGTIPHLKVYKNNTLLANGTDYELTKYGVYNIVIFIATPAIGDKLNVAVYSNTVSGASFYEVPKNLDQNPLNEKFSTIALGQIRTHYNKLIENTSTSDRPLQDDYLKANGGTLSQHSAPLVYAMTFLNDPQVNFVNGLELAKKEYSRFKNKFINLCSTLSGLDYNDPISGVDAILQNINSVKNNSFPWYYSDMVPQGGNYTTLTYTVLNVRQTNYEINSIFDSAQLSNRAVLIWHNGVQLTLGNDYTFSTTVPSVIFTKTFNVGDTIVIRDYFDTDGNFIPETPSKLGLYPKSEPIIYEDTTYQTPTQVIRGHDGSLTPVFGDFRDAYLLELEKRIYNNIKADYTKNIINLYDILPGRFRSTEYTRDEFVQVLSKNFLQWSGANNIDYTTNTWFDANNSWTWNYDKFTDSVDDKPLQGSWRAIYQYWYDTDQPNLAPWQMLGFGFEPSWWSTRYGPAPYTSGNFTLWEDLEAGYIWNNGDAYTDERFARPGLTKFIPVDTAGNLLPPADTNIVKQYNISTAGNSFVVGQQGPVETAWRRSSDYPFAVQMALAMCKPASYFGTQYDTSRFYVNTVSGQFTDVNNQKITPSLLLVNGDATTGTVLRTSGYINWIADAIKNVGIDPIEKISNYLDNLSVKLNYKVGGFTDKNMITVTAEQTAPGTTRAGVIIPDSNYAVYLNKSVPLTTVTYSAVIVQRTDGGYTVTGYDTTNPFFTILPSVQNSNAEIVTVDEATAKIYTDAQKQTSLIPYGTTFATVQQLSDFLISYERQLIRIGFNFSQFDPDLQEVRNFRTSVKEFLYWSQQGWDVGTVIVLNPTANSIVLRSVGSVVDDIANTATSGKILDQNFVPIKSANFNILRVDSYENGNAFKIVALDSTGICLAKLHLVQYEHVLVFDNQSDFGDIIYIPSQGVRQYRLKLAGTRTGSFTGALNASGYIYSTAQVNDWATGVDYQVGDIVTFNNNYYTALNTIPATTKFNITEWAQIQEQDIKTGLLPSFGTQAQQFDSIYDVDHPPSNESLQLFSAGLIGFRPRSYLTDLGISIPNQTKFYQGYIKEKGSLNSITALTKANFNNVSGAIELFEEWGFKVGQYGDLDRNQFREFVLDQNVFGTNPVAFTSTTEFNAGNIIVELNGNAISTTSNIYNSNNLASTVTTLYTNRDDKFHIEDLPSAGPVYVGDTDLSIFNINTYFDSPDVTVGSKIWTAVGTDGNWNVYRVTETDIIANQLVYTLDDYAQLQFDVAHDFVTGDLFVLKGFNVEYFNNAVLKNFNTNYDAVYRVINVVDSTTVTIQIHSADTLNNLIATSPVLSEGTIYKLVSARISSVQDIDTITPLNGWIDTDRVWVANAVGTTGWGVYEFNKAYPNNEQAGNLVLSTATNDLFGSRILTNTDYFYISNPGQKRIQVFAANTHAANTVVSNTNAKFGQVFDLQGNLLAVASTDYINIYRHNDSTTINTVSTPWVANAFPTSGTPWTANTTIAFDTQISYSGNTYVVKGNVYGSAFTNSSVQANVVQAVVIPVNSIITNAGNVYVTIGNVCQGNVLNAVFSNVVTKTHQLDLTAGNITLLQTINATANVVGAISSIAMSGDGNLLYVGGNDRVLTYSTVSTNPKLANVIYKLVSANTGATSFGSNIKTNSDGTRVFVTTPLATDSNVQNGNVSYYTRIGNVLTSSGNTNISSNHKNTNALFGTSIDIDSTASNLFIGAPGSTASGYTRGAVEHYVYNGSSYVYQDTIVPPATEFNVNGDHATRFGTSISISGQAKTVAVGAAGGSAEETTIFANGTVVTDTIVNSGSVYIFEPLIDLTNGTFTYSFAQELETGANDTLTTGDNFGTSVHIKQTDSLILVGAPGTDSSAGKVYTFANPTGTSSWVLTRSEQPKVDIKSINRSFIYNKSTNNILATIDIIDPAKGKILTSVDGDIDYKLQYDPASYNAGTVDIQSDFHWGPDQVGRIWWNLDAVRYIDYEQDALIYRLNHWGDTFPGSSIDVYEWVESTVLPSDFVASGASGIPLHADNSAYSTYGYVDQSGSVRVKYYFWVSNRDQANTTAGKQNSVNAIVSAIESPQNQNVPYVTVLRDDTVAIYNIKNLLVGQNSVLHLGSQSVDAGLIHTEYALVQEKSAGSQIPASILSKLVDSLAGADAAGNPVPDPTLPPSQRYGVEIRVQEDRLGSAQTLFVHRTNTATDTGETTINKNPGALENYLALVNEKLLAYPVTQRKVLTTLTSGEVAPSAKSGDYRTDLIVNSVAERNYINTDSLETDDSILVTSDNTQLGKWSIYTWTGTAWELSRVQSYKTDLYWDYANWYDASFDPTTAIDITVNTNLEFGKLILKPNTYIKVLNAGNDKFAIYYINSALERVTVGLESGTIQITTGTIPSKELRQILLSMQNEIFIDDLAQDFNEIFFAMIKFALTEQKNIDWAFKTSFISATQFIRKLEQFPSYISDNQDFYQTYINEVKPYRTILREFNINYQRNDQFSGDITDFDLAPYWDSNINVYRSPSGEQSYDDELLNNQVYRDWKNNYNYSVVDVTVGMGGTGYILPPQIIITGGGGTGANAVSQINEFGQVANITIVDAGTGYTSTPTVVINGTGSGAVATAVLRNVFDGNDSGHNVVRSIKTNIKFDRVTYDKKRPAEWANTVPETSGLTSSNAMVMWDEVTSGQIIAPYTWLNLNGALWQMSNTTHTVSATLDFPINDVTTDKPISAGALETANDRIVAYYGNIDLSATAGGIDYPGVIVDGSNYFAYDTISAWTPNTSAVAGTQVSYNGGVYVVNGNISAPTFDDIIANVTLVDTAKIDAIIQSRFADNLGVDAGNIYVDGGKYVDTFSSHAPEELVPGYVRDSINLQVFGNATPGTIDYAFRIFSNVAMVPEYDETYSKIISYKSSPPDYYRISNANTTTLVEDLLITDTQIVVDDATRLPNPNRSIGIPGEIFINGEKIVYYRNYSQESITPWASNTVIDNNSVTSFNGQYYLTTGNVFAINVAWEANTVFASNSYVYYSGNTYQVTGNVNAPAFDDIVANTALMYNDENSGFASIASSITLIGNSINVLAQIRRAVENTAPNSNTTGTLVHAAGTRVVDAGEVQRVLVTKGFTDFTYTESRNVTANVTLKLDLLGTITANVGDFLLQKESATVVANLRVLGNVVNSSSVAAILVNGTIGTTTANTVSVINWRTESVTATSSSILSSNILGQVDSDGNITIPAGSWLTISQDWYGNTNSYFYGNTLSNSTTLEAEFLKASPGFLP